MSYFSCFLKPAKYVSMTYVLPQVSVRQTTLLSFRPAPPDGTGNLAAHGNSDKDRQLTLINRGDFSLSKRE
jgi:hypothetical protein